MRRAVYARRDLALAALAAVAGLAACGRGVNPPWLVNKLRVLALQAEPPEAAPGVSVALDALEADPTGMGRTLDHLWIACTPPPAAPYDPCANLTALPGSDGGLPLGSLAPCGSAPAVGLCLAGSGSANTATFAIPTDALPSPRAVSVATFVLVTAALTGGAPACLSAWQATGAPPADCVVTTKQIPIDNLPPALQNHNPTLTEVDLDGTALPATGGPTLAPGSEHTLTAVYPLSDSEPEIGVRTDGGIATETLDFAFYATAGSLDSATTGPNPDAGGAGNNFTMPGVGGDAGVTSGSAVSLWVVIRDDRGGVGWLARQVLLGP